MSQSNAIDWVKQTKIHLNREHLKLTQSWMTTIELCTFQAIWKPFKENIHPLLPKKGKLLTTVGHEYGVYTVECEVFVILGILYLLIVPGNTLLSFLMKMCSEVESKIEYHRMPFQIS